MIRFIALVLMTLSFAAVGQPANDPVGTVDGALNPESIPDVVAYRLLFSAIAHSLNTGDAARARAQIGSLGLSAADQSNFVNALNTFSGDLVAPQNVSRSLDDVATTALALLKQTLTLSGLAHLDAYVHSQKRYIKRFPYPLMNGMPGMTGNEK